MLPKMLPSTCRAFGSIADTLLPTARQSGSVLSQIDFATLLQQAMTVLPGDSVALNLGPPR